MATTAARSGRQILENARRLFEALDSCAAAGDRERRVPHDVVEQMRAGGLFSLLVPAELGGAQVDLQTFVEVLERAAYANGAAGWDVATSSVGGFFALGLPRAGLDHVYAQGPDVIFAGTVTLDRDAARATSEPGGYRLSGRWRFGSGSQDADWLICSAVAYDGDATRLNEDGGPDFRYFLLPRTDAEVLDTWQTIGMRGTGSHDWRVQGCFVPDAFSERSRRVQRGGLADAWPGALYRFPLGSLTALHFSAVGAGIARRAIDSLVELANFKTPHRSPGLLRERVQAQEAVARAEAVLESARAYRDRVLAEAWQTVEAGGELSLQQRARVRLAGSYLAESAGAAVDLVYGAGGTTSTEESFVLSRCFRDVHVLTQSVAVTPLYFEQAGRVFLGLEPTGNLPY